MTRLTAFSAFFIAAIFFLSVSVAAARTGHHTNTAAVVVGPSTAAVSTARAFTAPKPVTKPLLRHRGPRRATCTDQHWKRSLLPAERWIDRRESGLNPASREPTTGAYGLGQLLPSTYRNLGLVMSASPCDQIEAQRAYMAERYGTWGNALAHWRRWSWW
jgi:hypothetical protein